MRLAMRGSTEKGGRQNKKRPPCKKGGLDKEKFIAIQWHQNIMHEPNEALVTLPAPGI
jgi:hypothetical protein